MTIDLQKFCSNEGTRPYIQNPWTAGEYTYATNGHILVRVPKIEGIGPVEKAPPGVAKLFEEHLCGQDQAAPLPKLPHFKTLPCKICRRTGRVTLCETCSGEGYQECDLGHDHDCEDCDGNGVVAAIEGRAKEALIDCEECDGSGYYPDAPQGLNTGVIIAKKNCLKLRYLQAIASLPNPRIKIDGVPPENPVPFWFDGGEGLLMQMRFLYPKNLEDSEYIILDEAAQ